MKIFDEHPVEIGVFIIVLAKIVILIQVITANKSSEKSKIFITWKSFFKDYLFLIMMLFYGLILIFNNI